VLLKPGQTREVEVPLELKYVGSYWDEERDSWVLERGTYGVLVGGLQGKFEVKKSQWWKGL
jgi:beta-glucosidase